MQVPLQIVFEGMDSSEAVQARIHKEAKRLERFYERITSCRVAIEMPHRRHHQGNLFDVRIHITTPGSADIVVRRSPEEHRAHEDPYVALADAFGAARRQLEDLARKRQGKVKHHDAPPEGRIVRLFAYEGYGFIQTSNEKEIYFHRNAVADDGFEKLEVGDLVRFSESRGDKGPQASLVQPVGK